jgi:serine/threonine protein kinase
VDDGTAKLIDLGFAHRPGENAAFIKKGYVLGTVNYLAPELCDFDTIAQSSSDIFSFGVSLFEMLSGELPYPAGSMKQTLHRHQCDPPADIRRKVGALPPALTKLLDRLLSHRPEDRPRADRAIQHLVAMEIATLRHRRAA